MEKYSKPQDAGKSRVYMVSSASEFIEIATWLYSSDRVLFRGQTKDDGWTLIPSIARDQDRSRALSREQEILEEFKRESIPHIDKPLDSDWQWLALAQHSGLPTRLLDWTKNPLVALWFTVRVPAIDNQPGVVWAFHYEDEEVFREDKPEFSSPFCIERTCMYFPEHVSPFIQAQSGAFTVHHADAGRFVPLERSMRDSDKQLTKIEIPAKHFPGVRYHLFRMGVSAASLFRGLSGIAEKIKYDNIYCTDE